MGQQRSRALLTASKPASPVRLTTVTPREGPSRTGRALGREDLSFPGLRYAAAARLTAAGCTLDMIVSIIGHRAYQMGMKYANAGAAAERARQLKAEKSAKSATKMCKKLTNET